ncbi:MAG: SMC family ATPase, partial [Erysipelotrichaceae bacterium]|nr:SMC family ATPase [Erysipelotrichaceae bacterium]
YQHLQNLYLDGQAGVLAASLEEGKPCPVCGSIHHPDKAVLHDTMPEKVDVENAKIVMDEKAKVREDLAAKMAELNGVKEGYIAQVKTFTDDVDWWLENESRDVQSIVEASTKRKQLNAKIDEDKKKLENLKLMAENLPEQKKKLEAKRNRIQNDEKMNVMFEERIRGIQARNEELNRLLPYDSKEKSQAFIDELAALIDMRKKEEEKVEQAIQENLTKKAEINGRLKTLEEQLRNKQPEDVVILREELTKQQEESAELLEKLKVLQVKLARTKSAFEQLTKLTKETSKLEKQVVMIKNLANCANGNISGKEKIMLETYVQMTYFDRILRRANTRLMILSDGQYELKRKDTASNNRSQSGLEMEVIDHYIGSSRNVESLSGGEAFKASLSLALGLSEEIQSSAGGIQLDSMFIDEGFGSLDETSLQQALKVLADLSSGNRLVGIISHVDALKQNIDTQLIVEKDKVHGSHVRIQLD